MMHRLMSVGSVIEVDHSSEQTSARVTSDISLHLGIVEALRMLEPLGFGIRDGSVRVEVDNLEYGAAVALSGSVKVRYRVGKLTPKKAGAFVAVWRRAQDGSTEPFPAEDDIDLLVVIAREGPGFGMFVFPKAALVEHGIVSAAGRGGKRGFRLYPSWSVTTSPQAQRTQRWQSGYFLDLSRPDAIDALRARRLCNVVQPASSSCAGVVESVGVRDRWKHEEWSSPTAS